MRVHTPHMGPQGGSSHGAGPWATEMYYVRLTEANNGILRPEEISAVSPMDGITEAMRENHGTASVVSPEGRKL
jgi:hypothetical protein